jgi:hypothetical protein
MRGLLQSRAHVLNRVEHAIVLMSDGSRHTRETNFTKIICNPLRELVSCLGNKFSIADGASDLTSGLGPSQGLGILVPVLEEARNRPLQLGDAVETAAPDGLLADHAEPTLDQVQPRGAGRGEVEMEARMRTQPLRTAGWLWVP